jgi:hypothetical protein
VIVVVLVLKVVSAVVIYTLEPRNEIIVVRSFLEL